MKLHTVGEVSLAIGVSDNTIRNYTKELDSLLSDSATRRGQYVNRNDRLYTEADIYILHTANKRKNRNNSWEEVIEHIDKNGVDTDMPASASLILSVDQASNFADKLLLAQQLKTALDTIDDLKGQLDAQRGKELDYVRQIARLELQIEMLREQLKKD